MLCNISIELLPTTLSSVLNKTSTLNTHRKLENNQINSYIAEYLLTYVKFISAKFQVFKPKTK